MKPTREDLIHWCRMAEQSEQYILPEIAFLWALMHLRLIAVNPTYHGGEVLISLKEAQYIFGGTDHICVWSKWVKDCGDYMKVCCTHDFPRRKKMFWVAYQIRMYWAGGETDDFTFLLNMYRYVMRLKEDDFPGELMSGSRTIADWCNNRFVNVRKIYRLSELVDQALDILSNAGFSVLFSPVIPHEYSKTKFVAFVAENILQHRVSRVNGTGSDFYSACNVRYFLHDTSLCDGEAAILPISIEGVASGSMRTFAAFPVRNFEA